MKKNMETVNDIKKILDDSGKVLVNEHISQLSEIVTNKVMDIYELGVTTGMSVEKTRLVDRAKLIFKELSEIYVLSPEFIDSFIMNLEN